MAHTLQNRALRICLNTNNKQHISNLHNRTNLPLLQDRRVCHLNIYAFSRIKQTNYLDKTPLRTRRRDAPVLKSFKSNFKVIDRSVYLQTATAWNNMDIDIRKIEDQDRFKSIQKNLLTQCIPAIELWLYVCNYTKIILSWHNDLQWLTMRLIWLWLVQLMYKIFWAPILHICCYE